jgi:uncharacterized protein
MGKLVGVISDTHNLLRSEVLDVFRGVDLILHAGDIGKPEILKELRSIAPVIAVRGNNDNGPWAERIPAKKATLVDGIRIFVVHDLKVMDAEPPAARYQVIVAGHSHRPLIEKRNGILFLNPGSAGPRRFKLPISVARLRVKGHEVTAELIELSDAR